MDIIKDKASYIDHTNLSPVAVSTAISYLCREAIEYGFHSVCILPKQIGIAVKELADSPVKVCTVIGFPLGANESTVKLYEAEKALEKGADELDMVINLPAFKEKDYKTCSDEVSAIVKIASPAIVKVIIETYYLNDEEKEIASRIALDSGAQFIKTSTGFTPGGATVEDVALMRKVAGDRAGVKASGGIRSMVKMEEMLKAGASRIGTSSGVAIINEYIECFRME